MTPGSHTYFDHYQADPATEPLAIGGFLTLEKAYSYEPVPADIAPDKAHHVLGTQGQLWSEYMPTPQVVEYMAWPRMCALAEIAWSPKQPRDFAEFTQRLEGEFARLRAQDVNYFGRAETNGWKRQ
jgi:hexosaminidase